MPNGNDNSFERDVLTIVAALYLQQSHKISKKSRRECRRDVVDELMRRNMMFHYAAGIGCL